MAIPYILPMRRIGRDDSGSALVEMAVIVPVIAAMGFGVIEFANYFYNYQLIQSGVRDAARYAASIPYDSTNTTKNDAAIKNIAVTGVNTGGTKRVSWWSTSDVTVTWGTVANTVTNGVSTYRYSGDVPVVTVSTSVTYPSLGFLGFLGVGAVSIKASQKERVFGLR